MSGSLTFNVPTRDGTGTFSYKVNVVSFNVGASFTSCTPIGIRRETSTLPASFNVTLIISTVVAS